MKWLQILLAGMLVAQPVGAEVYEYINEQGQRVFTDAPPAGKGNQVDIPPVMTYSPQVVPVIQKPTTEPQNTDVDGYKSVRILSPQQNGTVRNNQGIVQFQYLTDPPLKKGDEAILYLDEKPQPSMKVESLVRGEHQAQIRIVDINGTEKISSDVVTFFLHHQSRLLNK